MPRLIKFAQHFIAIVLDEQHLIVGEWSRHLHARNQVFTRTGKFMHVLIEVHESYLLFVDGVADCGTPSSAQPLATQIDDAEIPPGNRVLFIGQDGFCLSAKAYGSVRLCAT